MKSEMLQLLMLLLLLLLHHCVGNVSR